MCRNDADIDIIESMTTTTTRICGHAIPDAAQIIGLTELMADQLIGQTLTHTHTRPLGICVFVAVIEAINDFGAVRTYMVYV